MRRIVHAKLSSVRRHRGRSVRIAALCACAALSGAILRPALATEAPVPGTAAWSLVHETGQTYCLAHAFFPGSRIALGFVSDGERLGVALVHTAWRLRESQEYEVVFRFDGGEAIATRFVATDETAIAAELDADAEQDFRRAAAVEIVGLETHAGGRLSLSGSARAMDYVRACGEIATLHLGEKDNASIRD